MSEHFISRQEAESDLLSCATYLGERITSVDGHADAMLAVVPLYLEKRNVDLAAELSNTVDDPFTRDRLLTLVAEKCAELEDDEYALQLAEAVEDHGLQAQAFERVALRQALRGNFDGAREAAGKLDHPDGVLAGISAQQAARGMDSEADLTISEIAFPGAAVGAFHEIAIVRFQNGDAERAITYLDRASERAVDIEHAEEKAHAYCDIGNAYIELGRNDKAVESFDRAKATAETIEGSHRDVLLSLAAEGLLRSGSLELADRALDLVSDKTQIAACLLGYSRVFWQKGEREEAIEALEESRAMLESQHERETRDSKRRFRLFTEIAAQFAGFEKGERAIEIAEAIKDEGERTSALNQVAAILTVRGEDEQARQALRAIADDGDRVFALLSMSDAKQKNGERDGALDLLKEAATLAETVPQHSYRAMAYIETGRRFNSLDDRAAAREMFESALETIKEIRDESVKVKALADLAAVMVSAGADTGSFAAAALRGTSR